MLKMLIDQSQTNEFVLCCENLEEINVKVRVFSLSNRNADNILPFIQKLINLDTEIHADN